MPDEGSPGQTGAVVDPFRAYNFKCEIQGVTEAHFTRCSGLGVRVQAISWREAGIGQIIRRLAGPVEYADITLSYGLTSSMEMWRWLESAVKGTPEKKNIALVVYQSDGATEALRWNVLNAWISEWRGSVLDALGRDLAIEHMTLVCEKIEPGL